jgi:glucose-1-phosphate thymidylyltransferase
MNREPKGILLCGGLGSRLYPLTRTTNKHLLPVFDKPMIYYSLSLFMIAGIRDILVVCGPEDRSHFERVLGNGDQWGIELQYTIQQKPNGIAEAFLLAENFIAGHPVTLVLGDNIIHGSNLSTILQTAVRQAGGATILGYPVKDPSAFGVVELDAEGRPTNIEEKPANPKTNLAVPGFYCYDDQVVEIAKSLTPSPRGELEITDINKRYLDEGALSVVQLGRGIAWLDGGTPEGLFEASQYIQVMQERTGMLISSPEEIAWRCGWITDEKLEKICASGEVRAYSHMLQNLLTYSGSHSAGSR